MPLQNRVTPFGAIVAIPERGTIMGNRGVIHNADRGIVRPWQLRRWIACRLEFRGRYRAVMTPRRWTELFFLDEASALAAGHRPCAECRNADYKRFRSLWQQHFGGLVSADLIDARLHADRLDGRAQRTYRAHATALPDGTFVALDGGPWLVRGNGLLRWTAAGYTERRKRTAAEVDVVTPAAIVAVYSAGYVPIVHASGGGDDGRG